MTNEVVPWLTMCHMLPGWDTLDCCSSCHDEASELGIEPCEIKLDGEIIFVCCKAAEWFRKREKSER